MQKEIEFAIKEARTMSLSIEQTIKFVMRMAECDYQTAKSAVTQKYEGMNTYFSYIYGQLAERLKAGDY